MSYYGVPRDFYRELNAETPGWQFAPVPGWGINPYRAGPPRIGVGEESAQATVLSSPLFWGGSIIAMLVLVNMADKKTRHLAPARH